MEHHIVGIRFQRGGKIYHFDASHCRDIEPGDFAVIETARGRQLGEVIQIISNPTPPSEGSWKSIQRKATPRDLTLRQIYQCKEAEAMNIGRKKASELGLEDLKIVAAEFSFDGTRLTLMYSSEDDDNKLDLRAFRRALQRIYSHAQIELHPIGPRDVAKMLGGMGACGMEERCCTAFLLDFSPISIKMAKEQGISLTPTEITGMCGRLRCCLVYEFEQYSEARKLLPKKNKRVLTTHGMGKVVEILPLQGTVVVELDNGVRQELLGGEVQLADDLTTLQSPLVETVVETTQMESEIIAEPLRPMTEPVPAEPYRPKHPKPKANRPEQLKPILPSGQKLPISGKSKPLSENSKSPSRQIQSPLGQTKSSTEHTKPSSRQRRRRGR